MEKQRDWKRPMIVLAALGALTVAALAAPAGAHFNPKDEKKHVKKIARRIAKKEATTIVQSTVGPTLFIEETELFRFGPISLSATSADQTIGTFGPFTLRAHCDEDPAGTLEGQVLISTTEEHSAMSSDDHGDEDDFSASDGNLIWAGETDVFPDDGSQDFSASVDDVDAHAMSQNGSTSISATGNEILVNGEAAGAPDCLIAGSLVVNP